MAKGKNKKEGGEGEGDNQRTIVLKIYLHCQECAKPVVKSLKGFEGVLDVNIDFNDYKVVLTARKEVDPENLAERVRKRHNKVVEVISPISKQAPPKTNTEQPKIIQAVLSIYIHCENCGKTLVRKIEKISGVQTVEMSVKDLQMIVKGEFEPEDLLEYVSKHMRKQASIVKVETLRGGPSKKEGSGEATQRQKGNKKAGIHKTNRQVQDTLKIYTPEELDVLIACDMLSDENPQACIIM